MRVRTPVLILFSLSCGLAAFLGFSRTDLLPSGHDKFAHVAVFFVLTTFMYFAVDTTRRRAVSLAFYVCVIIMGFGSEGVQHLVTRGERRFDPLDILANVVGSSLAIALCYLYHGRLLSRRKQQRYDRIRQDVEGAAEEHELENQSQPQA